MASAIPGRMFDLAHDTSPSHVLPSMSRHPSLMAAIKAIDVEERSESVIKIGTRASMLALIQANLVRDALQDLASSSACPALHSSSPSSSNKTADHHQQPPSQLEFKLAPMSTAGDRNKIEPLYLMGAKALWTKDLEVALMENVVDCIVHSYKDVPTQLPEGCEIAAVLEREDPRDAFVVKAGKPWKTLEDLPEGACVGSSSVRRVAQMRRKFPHLVFKDMRGNIDTRLNKLDAEDGPYDALILASAGLLRTQQSARITSYLSSPTMLHAVGQGAIGVEIRSNDTRMKSLISRLNHEETDWRTTCERTMLNVLEGGCSVPVGVETRLYPTPSSSSSPPPSSSYFSNGHSSTSRQLEVRAVIASLDGKTAIEHLETREVSTKAEAGQLGHDVALVLIRKGGKAILEELGRIVEMKNEKGIHGEPVQGVDQAVVQEQLQEMRAIDQSNLVQAERRQV